MPRTTTHPAVESARKAARAANDTNRNVGQGITLTAAQLEDVRRFTASASAALAAVKARLAALEPEPEGTDPEGTPEPMGRRQAGPRGY